MTDLLKTLLANHIEASLTVQGYHWCIEGPDFNQYHDFFSEVYGQYAGQVDRLAEYIRIVSHSTEYVIATVDVVKANKTIKPETLVGNKPIEMTNAIIVMNDIILSDFNKLFKLASSKLEQGLENYCADQIDALNKLNWKMRAITK